MDQAAPARAACEVCAKTVARRCDLLCGDCSRAFTPMLELEVVVSHRGPDRINHVKGAE